MENVMADKGKKNLSLKPKKKKRAIFFINTKTNKGPI